MPRDNDLLILTVQKQDLDDASVRRALARLQSDLSKASRHKGRGAAFQAQVAVAKFLKSCRFALGHQLLFVDLAVALKDLENGFVDPMLAKPVGKPNYRDSRREWQARKNVAVIIDTLIRCGMSKKDTIRLVRSRLDRLDSLVSSKSVKDIDATVNSWLVKLSTSAVKIPEVLKSFTEGRRTAQMLFPAILPDDDAKPLSLATLRDHPSLDAWVNYSIAEIDDQMDRMGL